MYTRVPNRGQAPEIDIDKLADALAKRLSGRVLSGTGNAETEEEKFDETASLGRMADAMTRGSKDKSISNDKVGEVTEVKKDKKAVDDLVNLLRSVDS